MKQVKLLSEKVQLIDQEKQALLNTEIDKLIELNSQFQQIDDESTQQQVETESLQDSVRKLEDECKDLLESDKKLAHTVKEAGKNLDEFKNQQQDKIQKAESQPRARYSVNLYREISKIRWSQDCKPHGLINKKSDVKTFKFDEEKQSQFFITNTLWTMSDSP